MKSHPTRLLPWDCHPAEDQGTCRQLMNRKAWAPNSWKLNLVPYQARHSAASEDVELRRRSLAEVKRRGNWRSDKSVHRYEKHGRLAMTWARHSTKTKLEGTRCKDSIEVILGQGRAI